jgi:hypothetical protein
MGIDYDGGMIVGAGGDVIPAPDDKDLYDWLVEDHEMDSMNGHFDCGNEDRVFGYAVPDIPVDEIDGEWLDDVKKKAAKFEEITGIKAELIGMQDIW